MMLPETITIAPGKHLMTTPLTRELALELCRAWNTDAQLRQAAAPWFAGLVKRVLYQFRSGTQLILPDVRFDSSPALPAAFNFIDADVLARVLTVLSGRNWRLPTLQEWRLALG